MKRIIPILMGAASIIYTPNLYCQNKVYDALKKGDTLPDIKLKVHRDTITEVVSIKNYKGKLLLLDFWGVHCADCIASMPDMLALQKQFGNQLQILVVTQDKKEDIERLWQKFAKGPASSKWVNAGKQLPFVMSDTVLSSLFPHRALPTHVWIDTNQVLKAIAYSKTTTASTIQTFLKGGKVKLSEQKFFELNLNAPLTWFQNKVVTAENTPYYSFITNHIEYGDGGRKPSKTFIDSTTMELTGISCINHSILDLCKVAYKDQFPALSFQSNNRIIIEAKDSDRFFPDYNSYQSWADSNSFCYALKMPPCTTGEFYAAMKTDIDRFFKLQSRVEKRKVNCWVLKQIASPEKMQNHGAPEKFVSKSNWYIMQNMEGRYLFQALKNVVSLHYPESPFMNEMTYKGKIDIKLPWNEKIEKVSLQKVQKALQHYGLDLVQEYRDIDMLVIKED